MATGRDETTSETFNEETVDLEDEIFVPFRRASSGDDSGLPVVANNYGAEGTVGELWASRTAARNRTRNRSSIVDGLLCEIYDRYHGPRSDSFDSDGFTECSSNSDAVHLSSSRSDTIQDQLATRHSTRLHRAYLNTLSVEKLREMRKDLHRESLMFSTRIVKQLKRRERRMAKMQKNQDILTAILQAVSQKRRIDTRMRFSVEPLPGKNGYQQWYDALKAVVRLPRGIPDFFRRQIWLCLADNHIRSIQVDWDKTVKLAFNERSNPDDDKLGVQIVKDLHRTGCSGFCGQEAEEDRVVLKRVLLAYARWNKSVGYCQGFNVLAALILEVMERKEDDALKVMIYLIDHVLPDSYFANNLRALSVDMAVFRQLLHIKLPDLSRHLANLQKAANDDANGHYEPPLTNVFTMQWFLTLFATCLPKQTVLRVWDSVFLEGSEVLLRTALAIWAKLGNRIEQSRSADDFYTTMGFLTNEMLRNVLVDGDELIQTIYNMAPFPFPHLDEIREKYMYSITPFTPIGAMEKSGKSPDKIRRSTSMSTTSDEEIDIDEDDLQAINCFGVFAGMPPSPQKRIENGESSDSNDMANVSPGAFSASSDLNWSQKVSSAMLERMSMDVYALKRQYWKIQQRQQQAHVVYGSSVKSAAGAGAASGGGGGAAAAAAGPDSPSTSDGPKKLVRKNITPHIEKPPVMNHLFVGKKGLGTKNKRVSTGPRIISTNQNQATALNHLRIRAHVNAHVAKTTVLTSLGSSRGGNSSPQNEASVARETRNSNSGDDEDGVLNDTNGMIAENGGESDGGSDLEGNNNLPTSQDTDSVSQSSSQIPTKSESENEVKSDENRDSDDDHQRNVTTEVSDSTEGITMETRNEHIEPTLGLLVDIEDCNSSNSDMECDRELPEGHKTNDSEGQSLPQHSTHKKQNRSRFKFDMTAIAAKLTNDNPKPRPEESSNKIQTQQSLQRQEQKQNSIQESIENERTDRDEEETVPIQKTQQSRHSQNKQHRHRNHQDSQQQQQQYEVENGHKYIRQLPQQQTQQEQKRDKPMTLLEMATQATTLSAHKSQNAATFSPTETHNPDETTILPVQSVEEQIAAYSLNGKKKRQRSNSKTEPVLQQNQQQQSNSVSKPKTFNPFPQRALKSGLAQAKNNNKFGLYVSGGNQMMNGNRLAQKKLQHSSLH
ncbi:TBC1 domain family member 30-like [Glandiceps talaboti]